MRPLRIALAQGALLADGLAALAAAGCDIGDAAADGRGLVARAGDVEVVRARPSDIATYVARGAADLGIVGKDVLMESSARVLELVDLGFGACRFVVAAPRDSVARSLDDYRHLGSLEVATKYPNVAERHFRGRGIAVEIIKVAGSTELAPQVGLSDWIVDLVATGRTLEANGLAVIEEIAPSTARLIANPAAYHSRRDVIAPLAEKLASWAAARSVPTR